MLNSEPTNNISPRFAGVKTTGSILHEVPIKTTAAILCDVTAYPIPIFRYFLCSFIEYKIDFLTKIKISKQKIHNGDVTMTKPPSSFTAYYKIKIVYKKPLTEW